MTTKSDIVVAIYPTRDSAEAAVNMKMLSIIGATETAVHAAR
jgi:hypothetical protein